MFDYFYYNLFNKIYMNSLVVIFLCVYKDIGFILNEINNKY